MPMQILVDSIETPALTKAQLAELLYEQIGLNKREAKDMVETFFEEIRAALENGDSVKLSGFATSNCATSRSGPGAIPRPARKFPLPLAG